MSKVAGTPAIETRGLRKRYGETAALDGVDLAIPEGAVWGLLGPNGAGKTTLVRILATLVRPDAGTARVAGFDVARQPAAVRERIGLVGQHAALDEVLTGRETSSCSAASSPSVRRPRAPGQRTPGPLRAGRRRRPAGWPVLRRHAAPPRPRGQPDRRPRACSSSTSPQPGSTRAAAPRSGRPFERPRREDGTSVLLTTQYLDEADQLADHIEVLDAGRVIAEGSSDELKARVGGDVLRVEIQDSAQCQAAAGRRLLPIADGDPVRRGRRGSRAARQPQRRDCGRREAVGRCRDRDRGHRDDHADARRRLPAADRARCRTRGRGKDEPVEQERAA